MSDEVMAHVCLLRLTQNSKLTQIFLILALGNCTDLHSSAFIVYYQTRQHINPLSKMMTIWIPCGSLTNIEGREKNLE